MPTLSFHTASSVGWSGRSQASRIYFDDALPPPRPIPEALDAPIIVTRGPVMYPHAVTAITLQDERSLQALEVARDAGFAGYFLVGAEGAHPFPSQVPEIGVLVELGRILRLPDGSVSSILRARCRVRRIEWIQTTPFMVARLEQIQNPATITPSIEAMMRVALSLFERAISLDERLPEDALVYAMNLRDPGDLADFIASSLFLDLASHQSLIEAVDPGLRLQRLNSFLAKELDLLELEDRIQARAQSEVDKSQREFYLREQLRSIQTELGELDANISEIKALRERLKQKNPPAFVRERVEHELARLEQMPSMSPEVSITRDYVDWILDLPWHEATTDNLDVNHAERVLNAHHYGLTKVKDRILEYIAALSLKGTASRSPILCFVGPPGVGKTSLARSIAEALGRRFVRVSLGGVRDEAEIRGHRRTYVGALPGRIIQMMRRAGVVNPLFVLDELDKLGEDFRGDPSSALLEVLDPEQNNEFEDHYLDLPYDLSRVLWITTANYLYDIPPALRDRLEVIKFPGYIEEEKIHIAQQFLIPRQLQENGLAQVTLSFSEASLQHMIREYTYEAGVRDLERNIASICRKVARRVASCKSFPHRITPKLVEDFLGPPTANLMRAESEDQIGLANGVAWDEAGGDLLQIEVSVMDGRGELLLTGQLGDVMQESAKAAMSYVRSHAKALGITRQQIEKSDVHIHVPEGSISKEGPSAGVAMAIALISAFTKIPVRHDVAMTGEITLRGRILPIGGLREKLMAAHRAGIRKFVLPKKNAKELSEVPRRVLREMSLHQVGTMEEVIQVALTHQPQPLSGEEEANTKSSKARRRKSEI